MNAARRLGRYRVGERIGTGGVADVFLAEAAGAQGWGKQVVLKCLRPHVADIAEVVESLIEEARLAQRLQHGNIVQVFEFEVDDGVPYVVMEYVDGCTLRELTKDLARRDQPMPLEATLFVVEQVAAALGYAHRLLDRGGMPLDIVHRDVKPSNILLSRDGLVKLADFGIAKVADRGRETLPGVLKGTPTYWAPEQAAGDPVDARADVFGLGVVLRELLNDQDARVDASLRTLAEEAAAPKASERLRSMEAFVHRLRDWAALHRVRPDGESIAALVRRAKRDKPAAVRVALDSALLSTAKGDATLQRSSIAAATVPGTPGWRRPALAGLLAAGVAASAVAWLGRDKAPDRARASEPVPDALRLAATNRGSPTAASESGDASGHASGDASGHASGDEPVHASGDEPGHASGGASGHESGDASGHESGDRPPTAAVDKSPALRPSPKARQGLLKVNTLPWAEVTIDGKPYGRVPVEVALPPGRHRIVLTNPTIGTKEHVVTVVRGAEVTVTRWPT